MIEYRDPSPRLDAPIHRFVYRNQFAVETDMITAHAINYLESQGFRYLAHFGISNAIEQAAGLLTRKLEEQFR